MNLRLYFILFLFYSFWADAQKDVKNEILSSLENKYLSSSYVGLSVFEEGHEILGFNSNKNFVPASVLKLFYTLTSIDTKGDDYKFATKFYYTGDILYDGTLEGDLVIIPSGDPTLGSKRFYSEGYKTILKAIGSAVRKKKISCIEGDIILVLSYSSFPVNGSWTYQDIGNYYAGGSFPLNINDNEYTLTFETGDNLDDETKITGIEPPIYGLNIQNFVKTGKKGSGDNAYIYNEPFDYNIIVKGTLPPGKKAFSIKGAMPNPPETFMYMLGDYFENEDLYFQDLRIREDVESEKTFLFAINSPPLKDIVKMCNNYSINMYSEALAKLNCRSGIHPNDYLSEKEIETFFKKYVRDSYGLQIVDGCGLSSDNLISPKIMNSFIYLMSQKLGMEKVLDILPKAGVEGYAKNLFAPSEDIWLKSGSISGVLNYSGIVKANNGKYLLFSIFTNNIKSENTKTVKKQILRIINNIKKIR